MAKTKYGNCKTTIKNIQFDSKLESYIYLKILEFQKDYSFAYGLQPEYILLDKFNASGIPYQKTVYKGDFNIVINGKIHTIDVKGFMTDVFKLKRKLFAKIYIKSVAEFEKWFKKEIEKESLVE